jgi:hypothetical protein
MTEVHQHPSEGGVMALAARFDSRYKPLAYAIPWLDLLDPL